MLKYAVVNPATGETIKEYPTATAAEIEAALADTQQAYADWSRKTTVAERAALAQRAANLLLAGQHPVTDTRPGRLLAKPSGRTPSQRTRYPVVAGVTPSAAVND